MDQEQFEQWQGLMQAQVGARITLDATRRHVDMGNKLIDRLALLKPHQLMVPVHRLLEIG